MSCILHHSSRDGLLSVVFRLSSPHRSLDANPTSDIARGLSETNCSMYMYARSRDNLKRNFCLPVLEMIRPIWHQSLYYIRVI